MFYELPDFRTPACAACAACVGRPSVPLDLINLTVTGAATGWRARRPQQMCGDVQMIAELTEHIGVFKQSMDTAPHSFLSSYATTYHKQHMQLL